MIDDECEAIGGMRIGRGTEVLGENLPQRHFVHNKSHITWARTRAAAVGSRPVTALARPYKRTQRPICPLHIFHSIRCSTFILTINGVDKGLLCNIYLK
jgi:hypothetical protein